jgi:hypothetical protein
MTNDEREPLLRCYYKDRTYDYDIVPRRSKSSFGGHRETTLLSKFSNAKYVHQLAFIYGMDRPDDGPGSTVDLPLLYGCYFDGCDLEYQYVSGKLKSSSLYSGFELTKLWPKKPTRDWPYPNFPYPLPFWPIAKVSEKKCTWKKFRDHCFDVRDTPPTDLIFVMAPPVNVGVSLWGRMGDAECVAIIWEVDSKKNFVRVTNRCT